VRERLAIWLRSAGWRGQRTGLRRLERAAMVLNPILVVIVVGLAFLDVSLFVVLRLAPVPP
jgi:hypothetical protein